MLAFLLVAGCGGGEPDVVLYVSADEHLARVVIDRFEDATGLRVGLVGDTELKKTTGLVERLRSERDHPQADVFWSSEIFQTLALADEGVLAPYAAPAEAGWPAEHRDGEHRWYAFAARARVIVYAPSRVPAEDVPVAWTDLTRSYHAGRIVMADPRFGTTGGHLGAMKALWDRAVGPAYYQAFLLGLRDNRVRLLPGGNAAVVRAVIDGEADIGLTDTDDVFAALERGADIDWVYPAHSHEQEPGNGTLLIPNTVGLVAAAPHPEPAKRLIDFLLSEPVERLIAETASHNVPLRPGLADDYPKYAVPDPLRVDLRRAAAARRDAVALAMRILTEEPRGPEPGSDDAR
ncbi:MAG: extracellular solute-binding protein [Planctomycetes bacterium]|nr:extracellular solute-binding protein [Planctomycetota bacterium]